jgi:hypothetical protein
MSWFNRKPKAEPIIVQPPATSRVEVELHKGASEQAAKKAVEVNQHVKDLLVENGFTLKIYLAAGGQLQQKKKVGNK